MRGERWRPIPSYEGYYEVSDIGSVRSLDRVNTAGKKTRGRVRALRLDRDGYPRLTISKDKRRKTFRVSTLVARAFIGPRPDDLVTLHLNGNKLDNRIENLAYGTQSQNMHDRVRHGAHPNANRTQCKHGHPFTGKNLKIRADRVARVCRACQRDRARRYKARQKASAAEVAA